VGVGVGVVGEKGVVVNRLGGEHRVNEGGTSLRGDKFSSQAGMFSSTLSSRFLNHNVKLPKQIVHALNTMQGYRPN
jgi:hypothetical protein